VNRVSVQLLTFAYSENTNRAFQRFIIRSFMHMRVSIREHTNMGSIVVAICCRPDHKDEVEKVFFIHWKKACGHRP